MKGWHEAGRLVVPYTTVVSLVVLCVLSTFLAGFCFEWGQTYYCHYGDLRMSQRTTSPIALSMFQSAQVVLTIPVLDEDGKEVALAGKDLRFVVHDDAVPPVGQFDVETGSISKAGNVASVTVSPSQSATAGTHYHWELWDVTAPSTPEVLANGSLVIKPAVSNVA